MAITIISDCSDPNAFGRTLSRTASLFPGETVIPIGVGNDLGIGAELEAAGNLIDVLDAYETRQGIVLVNVAPRSGNGHKHTNGTPFCYFHYENLLVVSTVGECLSLVKKLKLVETIWVLNIEHVVRKVGVPAELAERIMTTQFRSFEFQPRVARWLRSNFPIPSVRHSTRELPDAGSAVWYVDSFGNCKTTMLARELESARKNFKNPDLKNLKLVEHLRDVSDGEAAFTFGSSGVGSDRFVEIALQGGSAAHAYKLKVGSLL